MRIVTASYPPWDHTRESAFDLHTISQTVKAMGVTGQTCAGVTRQKVELLLPGDTDGSGYPGGIKQQFVAVRDMVEAILLQLKQLPNFQVLHPSRAQCKLLLTIA